MRKILFIVPLLVCTMCSRTEPSEYDTRSGEPEDSVKKTGGGGCVFDFDTTWNPPIDGGW